MPAGCVHLVVGMANPFINISGMGDRGAEGSMPHGHPMDTRTGVCRVAGVLTLVKGFGSAVLDSRDEM
jgi:hypothetical protein